MDRDRRHRNEIGENLEAMVIPRCFVEHASEAFLAIGYQNKSLFCEKYKIYCCFSTALGPHKKQERHILFHKGNLI